MSRPGGFPIPGGHLSRDGFRSVAFRSERRMRVGNFEAVRLSAAWQEVVRAKGFVYFEESVGYRATLQFCGARLDVRWEPCADGGETTFVMIGQRLLADPLLRQLTVALAPDLSETYGLIGDGCGLCEEGSPAELGGEGRTARRTSAPTTPTAAADRFASRIRKDTRFELLWSKDDLVGFRLPAMLGAEAEQLNTELLEGVNTRGGGRSWLAPARDAAGEMLLLQPVPNAAAEAIAWAELYRATELLMAKYFEGMFCGGCNCLEQIAGKALT